MSIVRTVTGDVVPEELGTTASHEHLWCDRRICRPPSRFPSIQYPLVLQDPDLILQELSTFRASGGQTIVDATVAGWGRDVGRLRALSLLSGVRVIATSGFYIERCHPRGTEDATVEALTDRLVCEITEGADGTPIRTGLLKAAISRPCIAGMERKAAVAVAQAHKRTGAAITTHSPGAYRFELAGGNAGTAFLDLFEAQGVDPSRVIIGHVDSNPDIRQLVALARRGAIIEFDFVGREERLLDETRVELLCRLVDRGFENQLLLSSDVCRERDLGVRGGRGYSHVLDRFVPRLRDAGFDDRLLGQLLGRNPARVFAINENNT